jgi:hypothetical protein
MPDPNTSGYKPPNWFIQAEKQVAAYLAQHPWIKNTADGLLKAGLIGAAGYVAAGQQATGTQITYAGIGLAFMAAVKVYAQHALDTFLLSDASTTPLQALKK